MLLASMMPTRRRKRDKKIEKENMNSRELKQLKVSHRESQARYQATQRISRLQAQVSTSTTSTAGQHALKSRLNTPSFGSHDFTRNVSPKA